MELTKERKDEIGNRLRKEQDERLAALSEKSAKLRDEIKENKLGYSFARMQETEGGALADIFSRLRAGEKPSSVLSDYRGYLGAVMPEEFIDDYLFIADKSSKFHYSLDYYRPTVRSGDYTIHIHQLLYVLNSGYHLFAARDGLAPLYLGESDPELTEFFLSSFQNDLLLSSIIAAKIDRGDKELEDAVYKNIMDEGGIVSHTIIRAIVMSDSERLYEALCKLMLAARLQEGVRQAVCELADAGTVKAFYTIFECIKNNDLIRFSSIKRAIATWTGISDPYTDGSARITEKTVSLISECLENSDARAKYSQSDDAMELYLSVWSAGFFNTDDALDLMREMIRSGSTHRTKCVSLYLHALHVPNAQTRLALETLSLYPDDLEIAAAYEDFYFAAAVHICAEGVPAPEGQKWFDDIYIDRKTAFDYYGLLKAMFARLPKKDLKLEPFVFPWYSATLQKGEVAHDICNLGGAIMNDEVRDECCAYIPLSSRGRDKFLEKFAKDPVSDAQFDAIIDCIGSREEYTREKASKLALKTKFREKDFLRFEGMMKYKAGDLRSTLVSLLLTQSDEALSESLDRMLSSKNEDVRLGALDMLAQLSLDEKRSGLFAKVKEKTSLVAAPSEKEQILIDRITGADEKTSGILSSEGYGLYKPGCFKKFAPPEKYTTVSKLFSGKFGKAAKAMRALEELIEENKTLEYKSSFGSECILGQERLWMVKWEQGGGLSCYPFEDMWRKFYKEEVDDEKTLLLMCFAGKIAGFCEYFAKTEKEAKKLGFITREEISGITPQKFSSTVHSVLEILSREYVSSDARYELACALEAPLFTLAPEKLFWENEKRTTYYGNTHKYRLILDKYGDILHSPDMKRDDESAKKAISLMLAVREFIEPALRKFDEEEGTAGARDGLGRDDSYIAGNSILTSEEYILACYLGMIDKQEFFAALFERLDLKWSVSRLSLFAKGELSERERRWSNSCCGTVEYAEELMRPGSRFVSLAKELYDDLLEVMLPVELARGDSETDFSYAVHSIKHISGTENFVMILRALGKDTLERGDSTYNCDTGKKSCLSHLLHVCEPNPEDTPEKLGELLKKAKISEKRLVEAAMYAPEWMEMISSVLGWDGFVSGCNYFMAHMRAGINDRRNAMIARYTPISPEELSMGAFDKQWFAECYKTLGEKRFSVLYDAAKYISDGAAHTRARKYADASLGKFDIDEMESEISAKRNKDTLMAYALLPLGGMDDRLRRYRFIKQFLKESKQFGAQRRLSESNACDMALVNLAKNAGYADSMRLSLAMETELTRGLSAQLDWQEVEGVRMRLVLDDKGSCSIECEKGGKALKSIPASLKKNAAVIELKETQKALREQYSRTKNMLEQSMEDSAEFTSDEINLLLENPVAAPMLSKLVYICGDRFDIIGSGVPTSKKPVRIAHTFDIYKSGKWNELQKRLFDEGICQPFKQVFRELYIKTDEELGKYSSMRYSGNQIQPGKTVGAIKGRRWVADYEEGLQKIFYKEKIAARIYALADWFSPAEMEAPTLEYVEFFSSKTGERLKIDDIPDIIFSEVMRDVDLAVSVAHAGGVDPETSHSTIELRRAIVEFNLPLFGLKNVTLNEKHAIIKGSRAEYSVHLGSGIVHRIGGAQIPVLPVHSQHRGRLFLPFVDDDPKTAEIMSKIVLFAQDEKIKDPAILSSIMR